ncbi:MAG: hypothetical protein KGO81_02075 [Bacteroidota bacterium]|nr:hypothetical protein [Bacteroidota bacterium]
MKKTAAILFCIISLAACKKELSEQFYVYNNSPLNDTTWNNMPLSDAFIDSIEDHIGIPNFFIDSANASTATHLNLNDSIEVTIPANSCTKDGNYIIQNGFIQVQLIPLLKRGDFIRFLVPTINKKYVLESAGNFYLRLIKDGQEVYPAPNNSITIKWRDPAPKTGMSYTIGYPNGRDSLFAWQPLYTNGGTVTIWDSTGQGVNKKGYLLQTPYTDWIGAMKAVDTTQGQTRLNVVLPLNYTNKNTMVFAVFNNTKTAIKLDPDLKSRTFYAANIPLNTPLTLISISLMDQTFYVGQQSTVLTNANPVNVTPQKTTLGNLNNVLDNL